jgi:hypothetical protein
MEQVGIQRGRPDGSAIRHHEPNGSKPSLGTRSAAKASLIEMVSCVFIVPEQGNSRAPASDPKGL